MTAPLLLAPVAEAVAEWLLHDAMWNREQAMREWATEGVTPVHCGLRFAAIRLPLALVNGAARSDDHETVDAFLADALHGAPVIRGSTGQWLYVLVETGYEWKVHGIECVRGGSLGVPRPDLDKYPGETASYWAVPMAAPDALGTAPAVSQLIAHGRLRVAQQEGTP